MSIVIPTSKAQLDHVANAIMRGIHDVFPADIINSNNPISEKEMIKGEAQYRTFKTLLGFDFDGRRKTGGGIFPSERPPVLGNKRHAHNITQIYNEADKV